jgi:4-hydroxy-3-methylbut-2-enyl diphosphate reductase
MHILNNLTGIKADHYNDPDRAAFYRDYMILLTFMALSAGGTGLMIAYTMGWVPFSVLLIMSLMGLSYNLRLVPERLSGFKYRRIRDIPGSKTLLIAMAWGIVTSILPALATSGSITLKTVIVLMWSVCMVFARTAFFDILDMQGDRIVGKETIPILIGEKLAMHLLKLVLAVAMLLLLSAGVLELFTGLGFVLTICPVFIFLILSLHEKGYMLPGIRLEFLVETQFVLSGIIAFIWSGACGF